MEKVEQTRRRWDNIRQEEELLLSTSIDIGVKRQYSNSDPRDYYNYFS